MYRDPGWMSGCYIDNHTKYECMCCGGEFILGEEHIKHKKSALLHCPYGESINVEDTVWIEDDQLEELASNIKCLVIGYNDRPEEVDKDV